MRQIKFNRQWKRIGSGHFSHYYKISPRRGIKLLHNEFDIEDDKWDIQATIREAKQELKYLQRASITRHAPKGYEVVIVKVHKKRCKIGIIMEHLDAVRVARVGWNARRRFENKCGGQFTIEEIVRNTLLSVGLYHDDLHTGNILAKTKNRKITTIYAIDFSPECVYFTKRQKVVFK